MMLVLRKMLARKIGLLLIDFPIFTKEIILIILNGFSENYNCDVVVFI